MIEVPFCLGSLVCLIILAALIKNFQLMLRLVIKILHSLIISGSSIPRFSARILVRSLPPDNIVPKPGKYLRGCHQKKNQANEGSDKFKRDLRFYLFAVHVEVLLLSKGKFLSSTPNKLLLIL